MPREKHTAAAGLLQTSEQIYKEKYEGSATHNHLKIRAISRSVNTNVPMGVKRSTDREIGVPGDTAQTLGRLLRQGLASSELDLHAHRVSDNLASLEIRLSRE
jgi:hypothetical protein